jgi:predicted cobalt transporter CbtA
MAGLLPLVGRGALTGAAAGLLTGGVGWLLAEPVIDRAIANEAAHAAAHGEEAGVEVFTRQTQHVGLLVGWTLLGLSIGVLFAVVYAVVYRRDWGGDTWRKSLWLAGAGFTGVMLLPFLRYPGNPPGVGDPATIEMRTAVKLAAMAIGVAVVTAAV